MTEQDSNVGANFIRNLIDADQQSGKHEGRVATRFPPEPNGYLHIGHVKSICLNFGTAQRYNGTCNLRFDDTNPAKESEEYVNAIKDDVQWLGFEWDALCHASDYFDKLYDYAVDLIKQGKAYVDSSTPEQMREMRGTLTEPGTESPYRNRTVEENLELFEGMKRGDFDEGAHILRAKIDMTSGNINLRDPGLYRILKVPHVRTGETWKIYPMYDFTHSLSDALENITHSLCTLEFEDHRPLYNWVIEQLDTPGNPQQIEFAPLNLEYTLLSKRRLIQLVTNKLVDGWDDPRMPTILGLRRRGYTPAALKDFCERIGITKNDSVIDMAVLETCIRDDLNTNAERRLAVLDPIKLVITSLPEDHAQTLTFQNHPQNEAAGTRPYEFTREVFIEREDFAEVPPPKYQRLVPGGEVRLRGCYVVKCTDIIKNDAGEIVELHCTHDPDTLGKKPEGRKVKGVVHWVSAKHAVPATVRLYDTLFNVTNPAAAESFEDALNPDSVTIMNNAVVEPALAKAEAETRFQFERTGYFVADRIEHSEATPVFNRVVTLRDVWAKK